jgi:hypothetical protein
MLFFSFFLDSSASDLTALWVTGQIQELIERTRQNFFADLGRLLIKGGAVNGPPDKILRRNVQDRLDIW